MMAGGDVTPRICNDSLQEVLLARQRRPAEKLPDVVSIAALLGECGLDTPAARDAGRAILEDAGLTSPKKLNMALEKRDAALALLRERLRPVCAECSRQTALAVADGRQQVEVAGPSCEVCGGRTVARAILLSTQALGKKGLRKLLVVGGSPPIHDELRRGFGGTVIDLTIVDSPQQAARAIALCEAADVIVIWGSSILKHKTSLSFQKPEYRWKTVTLARRSIEAMGQELVKHAAQR